MIVSDSSAVRTCDGASRREFLRVGTLGLGGLSLADLLATRAAAGVSDFYRNKSVVLLFLQGGPPQIETFDPKMDQPEAIRSCTGEVKTREAGVTFGGTFPKLAQRSDRVAIVRSFASGDGGHNQLPVLTGNSESGGTMGSHVSRLLGATHPKTAVPTHTVLLPEAVQRGLQLGNPTGPFAYPYIRQNYPTAGKLGASYGGLLLEGDGASAEKGKKKRRQVSQGGLTENLRLRLPKRRFEDRRYLLEQLDGLKRRMDATADFSADVSFERQAFDVLTRGIADAFDIAKEDAKTIARYDTSHLFRMADWHKGGKNYRNLRNQSRVTNLLGKQMLLARRLCEAGCGFVTVVDGCWDFHGDGNNPPTPVGMPLLGPQVDHAVSAFLDDLRDRGLEKDILLIVTGEMGRSPKKSGRNGGTGHWGRLTPLLVAGGGLKMGQVIGETDRSGGEPKTKNYLPQHLFATVMQTLFDAGEVRLESGLPKSATDAITNADSIPELF